MITAAVIPPMVVDIDLAAFAHNLRAVRACLPPICEMLAVVKAEAYGHGAEPLARVALHQGATWLGVGRCEEGIRLRQQGIQAPILVLGPTWPEEVEALLAARLTPTVGTRDELTRLQQAAQDRQLRCPVHVNVDTGMGRLGFLPEHIPALLEALPTWPALCPEGLMTHLATSDATDPTTTQAQLRRFHALVQVYTAAGITPRYLHVANSAAVYRYPNSHWTLVRPGIALYGSHPFASAAAMTLQPVLSWKTRLVRVQTMPPGCGVSYGHTFVTQRTSLIGTLPVGYADGLHRRLSNLGAVLIHGQRAPLIGQICMGMCLVDLTDIPGASVGDEVVLIGTQGTAQITADEMAAACGTISYEIFCGISPQVPRRYLGMETALCP